MPLSGSFSPAVRATVDALERELRERLALGRGGGWVVAACPAPSGAAARLMDLGLTRHSVYFAPGVNSAAESAHQERIVGIGAAVALRLEGADRLREAQQKTTAAFARIEGPADLVGQLRFFGGASFSPGRDGKGPCWADFGDASFVLPRVLYVDEGSRVDEGGRARIYCVTDAQSLNGDLHLVARVLEEAAREPLETPSVPAHLVALSRRESEEPSSWQRLVDDIRACIRDGSVDKIVAARRVTLQLSEEPRLSEIIERMNAQAPRCARFALRIGDRTFVGATPEKLVQRHGRRVTTEALAGSVDARESGASERLKTSVKDQHEHTYVVEAIRQALAPVCETLNIPAQPEIRTLKHLLHLRTPIEGRLREAEHILGLVDRLHPTPAVGGLPREKALRFIESHERAERGWYAAPVGWLDAHGDGEFVVALRSGLICRDQVHLYAGAGIVAESDATLEFAETELKLSGMLGALGITN